MTQRAPSLAAALTLPPTTTVLLLDTTTMEAVHPPPLVGGGLAYRTEYDTQCWGGNDVYMSATDLPTAFVMQ